jgi:DNA-binding transcriptional ArsR family regulator
MSAPYSSDIAPTAALFADGTRAAMLTVLLDGRPLAAGELAQISGVSAATASSHLARLLDGDLVTVVKQGRHRYYRLKSAEVAQVIEALSRISPPVQVRSLRQSREATALQDARTCYDHLAGRAGAAIFEAMLDRGLLEVVGPDDPAESAYEVTPKGERQLEELGLDLAVVKSARRRFAGHCLDWTERRPHLNGALGAALAEALVERGWFAHTNVRRALTLTSLGREGLANTFGLNL